MPVFKLKWDISTPPSPLPLTYGCSPDGLGRNMQSCNMRFSDHPRNSHHRMGLLTSSHTWGLLSLLRIHADDNTPCSGPLTDYLRRWRLSDTGQDFTWLIEIRGLIWRALFFQTSKFKPSHCQRQHTELNEAVGWTNMANLIALTANVAHITLNYSTRHDWTHTAKGRGSALNGRNFQCHITRISRASSSGRCLWF